MRNHRRTTSSHPLTQTFCDRCGLLDALLENSTEVVWVVDLEGRLVVFNDSFSRYAREVWGATPARGMTSDEIVDVSAHPDIHRSIRELYARVIRGHRVEASGRYVVKGRQRHFAISATPVQDGGAVSGAVFSFRDITDTDRKAQHEFFATILPAIFASEIPTPNALRHFCGAFCDAVGWDWGVAWLGSTGDERIFVPSAHWYRKGQVSAGAEAALDRFARAQNDLLARAWASDSAVWLEDLAKIEEPWGELARATSVRSALFSPIRDATSVIGMVGFFSVGRRERDEDLIDALAEAGARIGRFLERRRIDEERLQLTLALEKKSNEWTLTFDAIGSPILILDMFGTILRLNRAAKDLCGAQSFNEIVGQSIKTIEGEHWRIVSDLISAVRDSRSSVSGQCTDEAHGKFWDIDASLYSALSIENDRVIVILRDITSLVELQDSVRRGEQLSSMGELVAGVAHEVRNPLFGMGLTLDTLELMIEDGELREMTGALRKWIERLTVLMNRLLEYGKSWTISLEESDISEVISQSLEACRPALDENAMTAVCRVRAENTRMLVDAPRLQQIFQNLVTNAIQHSLPNSLVLIDVSNVSVEGQTYVECDVRDFGIGFQPEDMHRIFQPFFTRRRGGTGLGLSIVQRIVEQHGGSIEAMNSPDGGALLRMRFPTTQAVKKVPARIQLRQTEGGPYAAEAS